MCRNNAMVRWGTEDFKYDDLRYHLTVCAMSKWILPGYRHDPHIDIYLYQSLRTGDYRVSFDLNRNLKDYAAVSQWQLNLTSDGRIIMTCVQGF